MKSAANCDILMSVQSPKMHCYRIIIINVLTKVTVDVKRCRAVYRVSGRPKREYESQS